VDPSDSRVILLPEALVNLLCISEKRLSASMYPSARSKLNLVHPVRLRRGTIELHELGGLQVPVNVVIRVRHREGLHTHSSRSGEFSKVKTQLFLTCRSYGYKDTTTNLYL